MDYMQIPGISKTDSAVLQNPKRATINRALAIASKSKRHYDAVLEYYTSLQLKCNPGTVGHELSVEYVHALRALEV